METIEQIVRVQIHAMLEKNEYYESSPDKERFVDMYIDNHISGSEMLRIVSEAVERRVKEIDEVIISAL